MNWQDIKIRAIPYHHVLLIKDQQQFVHLCCRLLQGRDDHTKERLSQMLRDALSRQLTDVYSVSVEVVDMHAVSYKKRLLSLPE